MLSAIVAAIVSIIVFALASLGAVAIGWALAPERTNQIQKEAHHA